MCPSWTGNLPLMLRVVAQAEFAFFDPKPDDFHGVKISLQTYLDNKQWDFSGFVGLEVGSVVKVEEDEDDGVFSLITALNLGRYKDKNAEQKEGPRGGIDEAIIYILSLKMKFFISSWSFSFPLHTQHVATHELRNYWLMGLVMAIEANKASTFWKELHTLIDEP
ncbi:hypothetical protein PVL29_000480 [Vitis rotundifolia]|uniref:Uncharacterized protein n=1 Tax=Vitis rotundifolia TaxID=103349 RepID=A0AA39E6G0_VITRO|nr:hypothetical protein PVL29_000480 [Vitis rotundifolia]